MLLRRQFAVLRIALQSLRLLAGRKIFVLAQPRARVLLLSVGRLGYHVLRAHSSVSGRRRRIVLWRPGRWCILRMLRILGRRALPLRLRMRLCMGLRRMRRRRRIPVLGKHRQAQRQRDAGDNPNLHEFERLLHRPLSRPTLPRLRIGVYVLLHLQIVQNIEVRVNVMVLF